jgi:hypothetical protein
LPWIRVEATAFTHPKLLAVKGAGMLLYLRSIGYAASHLTDGRIPKDVVPSLVADFVDLEVWPDPCRRAVAGPSPGNAVTDRVTALQGGDVTDDERRSKRTLDRRRQRLVRRLVEVGLWVETPDGYEVHDYLDYQPSAIDAKAAKDRGRELTRERVRRHREKKKTPGLSPDRRREDDVTLTTIRPSPKGEGRSHGKTPPLPFGGSASTSLPVAEIVHGDDGALDELVARLRARSEMR